MKKLFLSLLVSAGLVASITSCQQSEDAINPGVAGVDLIEYYSQVALANFEEIKDRQATIVVSGPTASGTDTWVSGNTYVMSGPTVVRDGDTLVIEEGALVKAFPGQADAASYLVVQRGGTIIANGSAQTAIVMTSLADRIEPGQNIIPDAAAQFRLPVAARGLWGGLLILGRAFSCALEAGDNEIEGIAPGAIASGSNGSVTIDRFFGPESGLATDAPTMDNSGSLQYVSIRHGGTAIGDINAGNEINGLTMGAVGRGTTIDFVEVFANRDDGFEWFGGTVDAKHLVASFCGDDHFDTDVCFQGQVQFMFSWQDNQTGDNGAEQDGATGTTESNGIFFASPMFTNATYLGYTIPSGQTVTGSRAWILRDNSGGLYANSIFQTHARQATIETVGSRPSSDQRLAAGELGITGCVFFDFFGVAPGTLPIELSDGTPVGLGGAVVNTVSSSPGIGAPDFILPTNAVATTGTGTQTAVAAFLAANSAFEATRTTPVDVSFFDDVTYKGAFDPAATPWTSGWTAWEEYYLENNLPGGPTTGI